MAAAPLIFKVAATALTAVSAYQSGRAADDAAQMEAQQLRDNAALAAQEGLRRAEETRRQKLVALSDARAAQASSGGTTTDAGALDQLGRLAGVFEYNALDEIYGSKIESMGLQNQANATRFSGKLAKRGGNVAALSTVLSNAGSIYSDYKGMRVPKGTEYSTPTRLPAGTRSPNVGRYR